MGLFKKDKDLKELRFPEAPMFFPDLPSEAVNEEHIPSFPGLQPISMNSMSSMNPISLMNNLPPLSPLQTTNAPNITPQLSITTRKEMMAPQTEMAKLREPVFIKIDKYREAMANFEFVKKRLQETSSLLDQIKDTRKREEEELNEWTKEMEIIKTKIDSIDKKVFGLLD